MAALPANQNLTSDSRNSVFISYRRDVSWGLAFSVFQNLKRAGIDVFLDHEGLESGHFDDALMRQIASRPYFLLFLHPKTLDRCIQTDDVLLKEITEAIRKERIIIPLYVDKFDWDDIDKFLPEDIGKTLKRFNGVKLDQDYFDASMKKLIKFIDASASKVTLDAPFQNDVAAMTREMLDAIQNQNVVETPVEVEKLVKGLKIKISAAPASIARNPEQQRAAILQNIQWKIILVVFAVLSSFYVGRTIDQFFSLGSIYLIGSVIGGVVIGFGFIAFYSKRWNENYNPLVDVILMAIVAAISPIVFLGAISVYLFTQQVKEGNKKEEEEEA